MEALFIFGGIAENPVLIRSLPLGLVDPAIVARHFGLAFFGGKGQNGCGSRRRQRSAVQVQRSGAVAFCFHHSSLFSGFSETPSRRRVLAFQDFLNYNNHVDVLRFHGCTRRESHPAMARWLTQDGVRKDRHATPVHAGDSCVAGAVCQCNYGMAPSRRVSRRVRRKPVSAAGVLRTRTARVHDCARSYRKGQTFASDTGGSR